MFRTHLDFIQVETIKYFIIESEMKSNPHESKTCRSKAVYLTLGATTEHGSQDLL